MCKYKKDGKEEIGPFRAIECIDIFISAKFQSSQIVRAVR